MRSTHAAFALTLVLLLGACGSGSKPAASPPSTPAGATTTTASTHGPYAVGTRTFNFVDSSRPTMANGSEPEKASRTLETLVEYPKASGKFPVIVYIHGFGAHADNPYSEPFAKAGYVVVAPKFPLTNTDAPGGPNGSDAGNEPTDIAYVLSQLAKDPDLGAISDTQKVAVFGESLGANVAMNVGFVPKDRDKRVKAVVAASGGCAGCAHSIAYTKGAMPIMFVHGSDDPAAPYQWSSDEYARATAPKFFLTLTGAKHVQYGTPWEPVVATEAIDFFNRYLKNDTAARAQMFKDANASRVVTLQGVAS
jgi:predicted dienelactone hydrolase